MYVSLIGNDGEIATGQVVELPRQRSRPLNRRKRESSSHRQPNRATRTHEYLTPDEVRHLGHLPSPGSGRFEGWLAPQRSECRPPIQFGVSEIRQLR